jgi:phenylacetate-coenzyme A ligase PaaK-like adenylate-forming protein
MTARFLRTFVVPPWAVHERSPYLRVAARLERERGLSLDERRARQWKLLQSILGHAWRETDFYHERFRQAGFEPGDLRSWDDFARLPVLTKQDVREHGAGLLARSHSGSELAGKRTSGSTGVSLHLQVDNACIQWQRGVVLYRDRWTGWDLGEVRAAIWGNPPLDTHWRRKLRNALLERTFYLDTLRMDEGMMDAFAREILRRKPTLLWGHAHSLYLFARFWEQEGYPPYRFKGVLSTAMMLFRHEREKIEEVFQSRVFDRYGCEETSLVASECEAHEGLHLNTDSLVVEIESHPGEREGRVIVTDLWNFGMPFIRYEIGDRAILAPRPCSCGRSYPLLERVTGRVADYLYTPLGELVSGISLTENFATLLPGVEQMQIVQDRLTHLLLRVVPAAGFGDASRKAIAFQVGERFGPAMLHDVELVDRIPPEESGKYRFTICRIPESERPLVGRGTR